MSSNGVLNYSNSQSLPHKTSISYMHTFNPPTHTQPDPLKSHHYHLLTFSLDSFLCFLFLSVGIPLALPPPVSHVGVSQDSREFSHHSQLTVEPVSQVMSYILKHNLKYAVLQSLNFPTINRNSQHRASQTLLIIIMRYATMWQ